MPVAIQTTLLIYLLFEVNIFYGSKEQRGLIDCAQVRLCGTRCIENGGPGSAPEESVRRCENFQDKTQAHFTLGSSALVLENTVGFGCFSNENALHLCRTCGGDRICARELCWCSQSRLPVFRNCEGRTS